ncbi:MAG: hypothetical protein U0174_10815 [Polyangiaceae bacterium]
MKPRACAALLAMALTRASVARASDEPSLSVERTKEAADCPTAAELREKLGAAAHPTRWVDIDVREGAPPRGPADVLVSFEHVSGTYRARIVVRSTQKVRSLETMRGSCAALVPNVVVALGLLADDPDASWRERESTPAPLSPPALPPPPPPPRPTKPPAETSRTRGWHLEADIGARLALAQGRPATGGPEIRLSLGHSESRFSAALLGSLLPSTETGKGTARAALSYVGAGAEACIGTKGRDLSEGYALGGCIHVEAGAQHGTPLGIGVLEKTSQSLLWSALGGTFRSRFPLSSSFGVVLGVFGGAVVTPAEFFVGQSKVYAQPPLVFATTLSIAYDIL